MANMLASNVLVHSSDPVNSYTVKWIFAAYLINTELEGKIKG